MPVPGLDHPRAYREYITENGRSDQFGTHGADGWWSATTLTGRRRRAPATLRYHRRGAVGGGDVLMMQESGMMHPDFTAGALAALYTALGRALSELNRLPPQDRTAQWILNRTIDELGPLQRSGDLAPSDIASFRSLHAHLALNVEIWNRRPDFDL